MNLPPIKFFFGVITLIFLRLNYKKNTNKIPDMSHLIKFFIQHFGIKTVFWW